MHNKATFVIPLGTGSNWENNELRYMVRSLEKYCQFDFDIVLFTTKKVDWIDCRQVIVKRTYPEKLFEFFAQKRHYENYYDVINKLRAVINDDDIPEEFFFMYDDMILLGDLYLNDLRIKYAGAEYKDDPQLYDDPKTKWMWTVNASIQVLKAHNRPLFMYETHLPRCFHKSKLKQMFRQFSPEDNKIPFAISTLYYNMNYDKPDINYYKDNKVKAGFYGEVVENTPDMFDSRSNSNINAAVNGKVWANHNSKGLTGTLKLWIEKFYDKKSKYEL
jgi:hypothetical protein